MQWVTLWVLFVCHTCNECQNSKWIQTQTAAKVLPLFFSLSLKLLLGTIIMASWFCNRRPHCYYHHHHHLLCNSTNNFTSLLYPFGFVYNMYIWHHTGSIQERESSVVISLLLLLFVWLNPSCNSGSHASLNSLIFPWLAVGSFILLIFHALSPKLLHLLFCSKTWLHPNTKRINKQQKVHSKVYKCWYL